MSEDPYISSYLFWKLSILIATLDKIHELLNEILKGIELDVDDRIYMDSARLIIKSAEVSLNSIKDVIESLRTPSAKNYFYKLYNNARDKLDLILKEMNEHH